MWYVRGGCHQSCQLKWLTTAKEVEAAGVVAEGEDQGVDNPKADHGKEEDQQDKVHGKLVIQDDGMDEGPDAADANIDGSVLC